MSRGLAPGETLALNPSLPDQWEAYRFQVLYRGSTVCVEVNRGGALVRVVDGAPVTIAIRRVPRPVTKEGLQVAAHTGSAS